MTNLKGLFEKSSILTKFILTAFIALLGFCFAAAIIVLMTISFLPEGHSPNANWLKIYQFILSIGHFVVPPIVVAFLISKTPKSFLSCRKISSVRLLFLSLVTMILAIPLINWLAEWNAGLTLPDSLAWLEQWMRNKEEAAMNATKQLLQTSTISGLLTNILIVAVLPAVGEELFFRGLLQKLFVQWTKNGHIAIWITALVFSAYHVQFLGFVPRLLLGAYLGYLLVWSGSIWVPVLAHFINNALAVICYFLYENGYITFEIDTIGTGATIWLTIVCTILLVSVLFWQQKFKKLP